MKLRVLLIATFITVFGWNSHAQLAIPNATAVTQNFNGMGSSAPAALPSGFKVVGGADYTAAGSTATILSAGTTGTGALTGTSTGSFYNFANGVTASSTDRAIGFLTSGSFPLPRSIIVEIENTGSSDITQLAIGFDYEKYRSGTNAFNWTFFHGVNALAVNTADASGNQSYPADANNTTVYNPPTSVSKLVTLTGLTIAAGTKYYLRWYFTGTSSNGQAIGIDNLSLTATFAPPPITTRVNGLWTSTATWTGGVVPTSAQNVLINHTVTANAGVTRDSGTTTVISAGVGTLIMDGATYTGNGATTVNGTFQLNNGSWASNFTTEPNFVYGTNGTLNFNTTSNYTVNNNDVFWPTASGPYNVNVLSGGIVMPSTVRTVSGTFSTANAGAGGITGTLLQLYGTTRIDAGGAFITAPRYANTSTLLYNSGGTYGRGMEWNALGNPSSYTPGNPHHVQISNNTILNYINGGLPGIKTLLGNLTIDAGSTFDMRFGGVTSGGHLQVGGNLDVTGTLNLGQAAGDDIKVGANMAFNTGYVFSPNGRAVILNRGGVKTVTAAGILNFDYLNFETNTALQLVVPELRVRAPLTGNAITFTASSLCYIDLNGNTLTVGTAGIANAITGSAYFRGGAAGTSTSNLTLLGTGDVGPLLFATVGFQDIGTLTINRPGATVSLGATLNINTSLTLTSGKLDVGNNALTLGAAATITGASATNYVIADIANGATASLRKRFSAAGSFVFPIGDGAASANGSEYSPVTISSAGGTYSASSLVAVSVNNIKQPAFDADVDFITRYWTTVVTAIGGTPVISAEATYINTEINGTEGNFLSNRLNGTTWTTGAAVDAPNNRFTIPIVSGTSQITAGTRNAEINIKNPSNANIASGGTYNFGTQVTGSSTTATFTIENIGQANLVLGSPTVTGTAYSITTAYSSPVTGPTGTTTFTITFAPTVVGNPISGSISIPHNDATGSENPYVINFTAIAILPTPEAQMESEGGTPIPSAAAASNFFSTNFPSRPVNTSEDRIFRLRNIGTADLTVTSSIINGANPGDFVLSEYITSASPVVIPPNGFYEFTVTFLPTATGTRNATVSFAHDDMTGSENPYTFGVRGSATCGATVNTILPASGPVGTELTITAPALSNLASATASLNGVALAVTQISPTVIKVIVPPGAISGTLITTNASGCLGTTTFNVIHDVSSGCEGGNTATDLFISEYLDANYGALGYVEIYNATNNPINLGALGYVLRSVNNGASGTSTINNALTGTVAANNTFVVALSNAGPYCSSTGYAAGLGANNSFPAGNINFKVSENDYIGLFKSAGALLVDSFGVSGNDSWADPLGIDGNGGVVFRRKNMAVVPATTFSSADWNITDFIGTGSASCPANDFSDLGVYNFIKGNPPTVTTNPFYTDSCKGTFFTVAGTQGFLGTKSLTFQWFVAAPGSANWTALTNDALYSGVITETLVINNIAGLNNYQYYCRLKDNDDTCYTATNAVKITEGNTFSWNGSTWTPAGTPTVNSLAVINTGRTYDTAIHGSIEACSITVNGTLIISAGDYALIQNDLTVNASGNLQVRNTASLVQVEDNGTVTVATGGTLHVHKTTSLYNKYDYTYWSSPIVNTTTPLVNTTIGNTFSAWRTDYAFNHVTINYVDVLAPFGFDDDGDVWQPLGLTTPFTPGKGYIVMAPTTGTFPASSSVVFKGPVNNGDISLPIFYTPGGPVNEDYNLVGNPYPSTLNADEFITTNTNIGGTLYFWTHRTGISASNPGPGVYNFTANDFAMYNIGGGIASGPGSPAPTKFIPSGQGFFVDAQDDMVPIIFKNSMREIGNNTNFYRHSQNQGAEKDRIWLNLQNDGVVFCQQLIGYNEVATLGFDRGYDGPAAPDGNGISFHSYIGEENYRIQTRPPFAKDDAVRLGYKMPAPGTFKITIGQTEGVFMANDTEVYLEDKYMGIVHDLKQSPYIFTTNAGTFDDRFVLKYSNSSLGVPDFEATDNNVVAYTSNGQINVKSYDVDLTDVVVYDVLGRLILHKDQLTVKEMSINDINATSQTLILKIILANNQVVTRKLIFHKE